MAYSDALRGYAQDIDGRHALEITLTNGAVISGFPGFALTVVQPDNGGGGFCIPGQEDCSQA